MLYRCCLVDTYGQEEAISGDFLLSFEVLYVNITFTRVWTPALGEQLSTDQEHEIQKI